LRIEGIADLPLHTGHVPPWLAQIMKRLSKAIVKLILIEYGREGLLRRLANPLWFQAFNNAIGMDWDSSGSTTVTTAILKEVLNELNEGIRIAGGKGAIARRTPNEIEAYGEELGLSSRTISELKAISVLGAKVDTSLLQDRFTLYHHTIAFSEDGKWVIVQQGMNIDLKIARRYHIAWYASEDLTIEPHTGIASDHIGKYLNLTDKGSMRSRGIILDLINDGYKKIKNMIIEVNAYLKGLKPLFSESLPRPIDKNVSYYRPIRLSNKLLKILREAYELRPNNMRDLLLYTNVGPETLRALSLISELIYREPPTLNDPVTTPFSPFKYAFTIGGKDGIPYPVKKEIAISIIKELERIIKDAEVGRKEKLIALKALSKLAPKDLLSI